MTNEPRDEKNPGYDTYWNGDPEQHAAEEEKANPCHDG